MVGKTLSHYEILAPLGAGGMGEVYRARDTKLDRDVAIKVLPEDLATDADRLARFEREARLLAALNHSNIGAIYGLEESDDIRFLVLELIEGETLERRLMRGATPVPEALDIARQIAEALEAAHDAGIIHRDVKPANVLLTGKGGVKVLDFGIAKNTVLDGAAGNALTEQATSLTIDGTLMGTPPYMAPEQIRGEGADKRADIWAFGCVVYEMLTGRGAFVRETVADTLVAVLDVEPDWGSLPAETPALVRSMLRRCLSKDAHSRLHDVADARVELDEALLAPTAGGATTGVTVASSTPERSVRQTIFAAIVIVVLSAAAGTVASQLWLRPQSRPTYVNLALEPGTRLWGGEAVSPEGIGFRPTRTAVAITPDGRTVVYAAVDDEGAASLYRRDLGSPLSVGITGTEGGASPFLSPAGDFVGFVVGKDIRVVPLAGGQARTVVFGDGFTGDLPFGVSWADDDSIVFAGGGGIFRVASQGGTPALIAAVDEGQANGAYRLPQLLPGGHALLYTAGGDVVVEPLDGAPAVLVSDAHDARFVATGHLLFARRGTLMACGFDPGALELQGECVEVLPDVMQALRTNNSLNETGAAQFSISESGTLVYATGSVHPSRRQPPIWVDRDGAMTSLAGAVPERVDYPRISPDGTKLAHTRGGLTVRDLATGGVRSRPGGSRPAWSPDGTRLAFSSGAQGPVNNLYWIDAEFRGEPQRITRLEDTDQDLSDWGAGNVLAFVYQGDIWVVEADGAAEPRLFVGGDGREAWPIFSPDGKWLAYASDTKRTGDWQVFVKAYPDDGVEYAVTESGGTAPTWSRDGSEQLFYRAPGTTKMMAVDVDLSGGFRQGNTRELFEAETTGYVPVRNYDVGPDGRFLMIERWVHPPQPVTELRLVINWFEELKQLVPSGR